MGTATSSLSECATGIAIAATVPDWQNLQIFVSAWRVFAATSLCFLAANTRFAETTLLLVLREGKGVLQRSAKSVLP